MNGKASVEECKYLLYTFTCGNCHKCQTILVENERVVIECCKVSYGFGLSKMVDATEFLD